MHSVDRFQRVSDLFERARSLTPEQRDAFLRDTCADDETVLKDVQRLLNRHDDEGGMLDEPVVGDTDFANAISAATHDELPAQIGRYRIRRRIGDGGMGVVYLAEQHNPRRNVAVKVIRPGFASGDVLKRFELEAAVLGRLQHPGIAQIYEAGVHEDESGRRSFFAMEYVEGARLNEYVRDQSPSIRERLALFTQICDAVHYAHRNGVVHRDLKPANLLVTPTAERDDEATKTRSTNSHKHSSPLPKILDFGVARATDGDLQITSLRTDAGQLIGTLPYMSPEQVAAAGGSVDTRSDVYALGVILYQLLSGELPYDLTNRAIVNAAKVIAEEEPVPLSTISRNLRGDLTTIVQKALEKDPAHRYQSASELAADVRRYLDDEPIVARPPTTWYHLRKFAQRNKGLVAGLAAAFVSLIAGVVVATIFAIGQTRALAEAERQTLEAEAEAKYSGAVGEFLSNMISSVRPEERGKDVTMREALDAATTSVDREPPENPRVEALIRIELGRAYEALADFDQAESQLQTALARARHGDHRETVATALYWLGTVKFQQGDYDRAKEDLRQAISLRRQLGDSESCATSLAYLSNLCERTGRYAEAERLAREALAIQQAINAHPTAVVSTAISLCGVLRSQDRTSEAEEVVVRALELAREKSGNNSINVARCLNSLALIYRDLGRAEEAVELLRESIEISTQLMDADHPTVATTYYNLGNVLRSVPKYEEAEAAFSAALDIFEPQLGREHPTTLYALQALGSVRLAREQFDEAEALFREVLEVRLRILGETHPETAVSLQGLASVHARRGEYEVAVPYYRRAIDARLQSLGPDHTRTLLTKYSLAQTLRKLGQYEDALQIFDTVLETRRRIYKPSDRRIVMTQGELGIVLTSLGRYAEAETMLLEAYKTHRAHPESQSDMLEATVELLVKLYESWDNDERAAHYRGELEALQDDSK